MITPPWRPPLPWGQVTVQVGNFVTLRTPRLGNCVTVDRSPPRHDLPADAQAAEPVQVGEGALDNPPLGSESGAVFGAASRDQWLHAERADEAAVLVVVVAAVTEHDVGAAPWPTALAADGWHCLEQRDELGDVVAVAAGQGDGERDAGGVGDQVVLAARSTSVDRASSRLGAPFNARMWEPSTAAREKSKASARRSLAKSA